MNKGSILIVDDIESNLLLLSSILGSQDYEVWTAFDGAEGMEIAISQQPDLIFMDIHMPVDGYIVCEQLKADPRTADIPVIFISALNDTEAIIRAFKVGGVDYIVKPFRIEEVLVRTDSHITLVQQRKRLEALRKQDQQRFQAITEMKNHIVGAATHDLKNPMFTIISYVTLMERQMDIMENKIAAESLKGIRNGVEKMSALVTDMLDMVQMESVSDLMLAPFSLEAFLSECVQEFMIQAQQRTIELNYHPAEQDIVLSGDEKRLKHVFDNLLSNAIKYTKSGGEVSVHFFKEGQQAIIEILDNGLGIPQEAIPNLFNAFYRVESTGIDGTGLGLSIVKAIVEQHHGEIRVESELDKGSKFSVMLPC